MAKNNGLKTTERLLGIIKNGGNGQDQRLFRIVQNEDMASDSTVLGRNNRHFCEISFSEQAMPRVRAQLDAIWSNILLSQGAPPHSVLLTSASKGEGVTYVSERLSLYLATAYNHNVLYVNVANQILAPNAPPCPSAEEVVACLTSGRGIDDLVAASSTPGLWVLNLGITEGQHALPWLLPEKDVLGSLLRQTRERFDVVVFDAQSVLSAPWTATMAKPLDVNLLVCRFAVTRREVLNTLLDAFRAAGVAPQGVILNARRYSVPQFFYKLLK